MSAPASSPQFFRGPATVSLVVGLISLLVGIWGLTQGNHFLFGLGMVLFMTGLVMKFLRNDVVDITLLTLLAIGAGVGILHFLNTKVFSHGSAHAPAGHTDGAAPAAGEAAKTEH